MPHRSSGQRVIITYPSRPWPHTSPLDRRAVSRTDCMFMHHRGWGERPLLPPSARSAVTVIMLPVALWSADGARQRASFMTCQVRARAITRAWLTLRIDAGDRAPRYSPISSLPSCSMQSALAYPVSGSAGDSLTQVGRSRTVVVSLIAITSSSRRLQLAGLRRERKQTSGPDGPALGGQRRPLPGRTVPAQVQFAAPLHTVCGTDRRSASVTCLVHSASSAFR
jgi:hypothetical protein